MKEFRLHKVPYIIVVGDKEAEEKTGPVAPEYVPEFDLTGYVAYAPGEENDG